MIPGLEAEPGSGEGDQVQLQAPKQQENMRKAQLHSANGA